MPDGRVFVSGGHVFDRSGAIGVAQTDFWDPTARTWTRRPVRRAGPLVSDERGPSERPDPRVTVTAPGALSNTVDGVKR